MAAPKIWELSIFYARVVPVSRNPGGGQGGKLTDDSAKKNAGALLIAGSNEELPCGFVGYQNMSAKPVNLKTTVARLELQMIVVRGVKALSHFEPINHRRRGQLTQVVLGSR